MLFLPAYSDYDLEQDEFYSDLYVVKRENSHLQKTVEDESEEDSISYIDNAKSVLAQEAEDGTVEIKN